MKSGHVKLPSNVITIFGAVVLAAVWYNLMPYQFGGQAVYLIISGVSMQPTFYDGDLVILHQTDSYNIGDIAAYREPHTGGGVVIHRLIAQEGGRFTLLGDNKTHPDVYRPTFADMVGKYWFHLPQFGQLASYLQAQDGTLPVKTILLEFGLIVATGLASITPRRRGGRKSNRRRTRPMPNLKLNGLNRTEVATTLLAVMLISAIAAYFAFTTPLTKTVTRREAYEHQGVFGYAAQAPPDIYDADSVQSGEPIFRALINNVTVNFAYEFSSELPGPITGAYRVIATLSHPNGWQSTIELIPHTPFTGRSFNARTTLDLAQLQRLLDNLEQQTGLKGQAYHLAIVPEISVTGVFHGQNLQEQFSPALTFDLQPLQMQLADSNLEPRQSGQIEYDQETANSFSIPVVNLAVPVERARQLAGAALALAVGSLLVVGGLMWRAGLQHEAVRIEFKYGGLLIPVQTNGLEQSAAAVEMESMDHLARLARQEGRLILHERQGNLHHYWVKDNTVIYHYQCRHLTPEPEPDRRVKIFG